MSTDLAAPEDSALRQAGQRGREAVLAFLRRSAAILGLTFFVQIVAAAALGLEFHNAVFLLEREQWHRMWTPFTSAVAHSGLRHLLSNWLGLAVFGAPVAALIGANRTLFAVYAGAVLGQLVGVVSGKGDLIGASAGVVAAAAWAILTSPLWLARASAWVRAHWQQVSNHAHSKDWMRAYSALVSIALLALYTLLVPVLAGIQLAGDMRGVQAYASFPWGEAPSGPGYTAHLFGFLVGTIVGLVHLGSTLWTVKRWRQRHLVKAQQASLEG